VKISREQAAANALEGYPRCPRCDKSHPKSLPRGPRPHLVGVLGRTAFGYLSLPDTCGKTWSMEWRRVPLGVAKKYGVLGVRNAAADKLDGSYRVDPLQGFWLEGVYIRSLLPHGTVFVFRGYGWVAARARSFWSRNKAQEWAKRWLVARVNTRGTKHREIFVKDLEVPDAEKE